MAEQTIIVMSDSHGERDIVADIKNRYQGKVDAIFHNGDSELESSRSCLGRYLCSSRKL